MSRAVFLDRDGVINAAIYNPVEDKLDSPYNLEEFRVLPGVARGVRMMNDIGFQTIVVSNQPGLAKGKCSGEFLEELSGHLAASLAKEGARLDGIYYCLHHPEAIVPDLRRVCDCRKPRPGLLLRAARHRDIDLSSSFMIGDQPTDIEAGAAAGCRTVLLNGHATSGKTEPLKTSPNHVAVDLLAAAGVIQSLEGES
ncbi:MAG: D-glycero-alpha-D-manno-heptose-1,7-bisphosphate 7-phosphatase [Dehalococcoidia bacterium]